MADTACAKCRTELPDDIPGVELIPCPKCGSTIRAYGMELNDELVAYDGQRLRSKNPSLPSKKKLRLDTYSGVEPSHKYGKLVRVERTFDRDNNRYVEKVIDLQTGDILHECNEPLKDHIGHGTAKDKGEP